MNNKYVNRAKISEAKFRELVRFFAIDLTATQIAGIIGLNRNTVNRYLSEIRKKISAHSDQSAPTGLSIRDEGTNDTNLTLLLLIKAIKAGVYTEIVSANNINGDSDEKLDVLYRHQADICINLETEKQTVAKYEHESPDEHRRKVNRIENFWGMSKSRLAKFKGIHPTSYRNHLKECEFRYNNRNENLYLLLLKILRKDPLF